MDIAKEGILSSRTIADVVVISFNRGSIRDEREILKTLESLGRYIESKNGLKIVLDIGNIQYLSSAGLGHLVGLLKKARARNTAFKLCSLTEGIQELFEVMRLTKIFEIHPGVEQALASFQATPAPKA